MLDKEIKDNKCLDCNNTISYIYLLDVVNVIDNCIRKWLRKYENYYNTIKKENNKEEIN